MQAKNKKITRVAKFLAVIKKLWYVIVSITVCFAGLGLAFGIYKNKNKVQTVKDYTYIETKVKVSISDGEYMSFSDSFNNSCIFIMESQELKKEVLKSIDLDEGSGEIIITKLSNITNMVQVTVSSSSKEEGLRILNMYIEKAQRVLNQDFRNNLNVDGSFREGTEESSKIVLRQIGNVEQDQVVVKKEIKTIVSVSVFVLIGAFLGFVIAIIAVYLFGFYFVVHSPNEVIKNFNINYLSRFDNKKDLQKFGEKEGFVYCISNKKSVLCEFSYVVDDILSSNELMNKEIVLIVEEDKDTLFFVEKTQKLLQNKIRGFVIYK